LCGTEYPEPDADPCSGSDALTCNDRGTCVNAPADFSDQSKDENGNALAPHETDNIKGMSCDCETGFTDVECGTTVQFCDGNKHTCLHGGSCVNGTIQSTGKTVHVCNCLGSSDDDGNRYVGLHCETMSTVATPNAPDIPNAKSDARYCDDVGDLYCSNGGTCTDPLDIGRKICDCPSDFVGYSCDYHRAGSSGYIGQVADACDLDCGIHGSCQVGTRNATDAETEDDPGFDPNFLSTFSHCRCEEGWGGALCGTEYPEPDADPCSGSDALTCNDRGTCVNAPADFSDQSKDENGNALAPHETDNIKGMSCDCETGFTDVECGTTVQFCDGNKHTCLHGGSCVNGTIQSTGKTVHVCNCLGSSDDKGNRYVGLHCETMSAVSKKDEDGANDESEAEVCDNSGTGKLFCSNEGTCVPNPEEGKKICNCPPDYVGYHCEYHRSGASGLIGQAHDNCNLNCKNEGECYVGTRNATDAEMSFDAAFSGNVLDKFQHCRCPAGFAGIFCEKAYTTCGGGHCYHEAVCKDGAGTEEPHCECEHNNTHSFVGASCQTHSTSFCTKSPGVNGHQFCTNNGQCKDIGNGLFNCTCSSSFHGQHCEFPVAIPLPVSHRKCDLNCKNNGKCMEGIKTNGILGGMSDISHLLNSTSAMAAAAKREYCDCPTGFAGATCEHVVEVCPTGAHVCFHGSKCVKKGEEYQCNCDASQQATGLSVAGKYCQHKSTTICSATERKFCVNDGTCNDDNSCTCSDSFRGPYVSRNELGVLNLLRPLICHHVISPDSLPYCTYLQVLRIQNHCEHYCGRQR